MWLKDVFLEAGLPPEVAEAAAKDSLTRLGRGPTRPAARPVRGSILEALVGDPLLSVSRILEDGLLGLPFHDPDTGRLSAAAVAEVLADAGEDPVVAMAYARVVVELCEPERFYGPVWTALGGTGELDLRALCRLDWRPIASAPTGDPAPTEVVPAEARRPVSPVRRPSAPARSPKPKGTRQGEGG